MSARMQDELAANHLTFPNDTTFNVFRLDNGVVRHFWGSELSWAPMEKGQDSLFRRRHERARMRGGAG